MYSLPDNYIKVEGIKNPSNAGINTGYKCNINSRIELQTNLVRPTTSSYIHLALSKSPDQTTTPGSGWYINTNGDLDIYIGNDNDTLFNATTVSSNLGNFFTFIEDYKTSEHIVKDASGNIVQTITHTRSGATTDTNNFGLFGRNELNDTDTTTGQIINYFRLYDYETESYVRYYIPCLNENNVAGFFDAARGIFQGSGNSTAFEGVAADGGDFAYINFEDSTVKNLCVTNWGGHYKAGEMYTPEARTVTSVGTVFKSNTTITKFNELEYFTGLRGLSDAFNGCTALTQIKIPHTTYSGNFSLYRTFYDCSAITGTLDCSPIKANTVTSISECFYGCHARTLIMPTTNRINQQIGWCFRGIRTLVLDLSPLAGSHLTIPSYCFYSWGTGSTNVETLITTGVYLNGANDNVILWHNANPCKVTTFIGGFMGWNKDLNLTYMPNIGHDGAMEVINSLPTVTEKTLTFPSVLYGTLTSAEAAIAVNKGWVGTGLWQKTILNGINMPFGFGSAISGGTNWFNINNNISAQVLYDDVDVTSTAVVNGQVIMSNTAENKINLTTNSNTGTITFSGTTDTGLKTSSRVFYSATQNGWYKVSITTDSNTTVLSSTAKGIALLIRRYCPYATRCLTTASIDYDNWEFVNVESFVAGNTVEAYGYMGVGDILMTYDTLDGTATFTVDLINTISIPSGYAIPTAMQSELDLIQITPGLRLNHSVETKFKINDFTGGRYWVGMYDSTLRKYNIGRPSGGTGYALYTYWGKNIAYPTSSVLVNSDMINNILYFKADKDKYLVKRISNGTQYGANYTAKSFSEATATYFYIRQCDCFWLKLWDNGTLVRNLIPLVDTETREYYRLYDLVEGVFFDRPVLLNGTKGGRNNDDLI